MTLTQPERNENHFHLFVIRSVVNWLLQCEDGEQDLGTTSPMMNSQNINSFISNFNYASTPDNLGQTFYNEESLIEQRSFTSAADHVNMQSNRLAGLPGWTMKGKGLDSPRWLSSVSITAI